MGLSKNKSIGEVIPGKETACGKVMKLCRCLLVSGLKIHLEYGKYYYFVRVVEHKRKEIT
jgi:hypothetical protein